MGVFTGRMTQGHAASFKGVGYYLKRIGVSVLFSGAAVGVSHVVQATRAGSDFSLALIPVILLCLTLKYPAFLFGPLYTKTTGESVVRGYSRIGKWTLPIVALTFTCVMFTVVAAVAMLAAGIFIGTLGLSFSITATALVMALLSTVSSLYFSFNKFQESMKIIFLLLVVLSVVSLAIAIPSASANTFSFAFDFASLTKEDIFFIAALIGWMPAGLDLPMMHSQWLLARGDKLRVDENAVEDFNFGYLSTSVLALLFVIIGAVFFFGAGVSMAPTAGGFSKQLLDAYTNSLGQTSGFIIGGTLFLAIFSTLIVVIDGFPRVLSEVISLMVAKQGNTVTGDTIRYRQVSSWLQFGGAALILTAFTGSLTGLVDFATITSFLLCPVFAILNHRIVGLPNFTNIGSTPQFYKVWSFIGIVFFIMFTIYYFYLNF